ncbi:MAG: heme A synthase [Myxococcales bacterium]|nr:heme A synthase [Myxococcales bacterium]
MLEHRFAQFAAACTFVLLIIGGTVNPTGSSLACPEPTMICHGQFLPEMTGGVLYEHGHRLAAMSVGLFQIALTVLLLRRRKGQPGMKLLAWATLGMVVLQGALGAITVGFKLPWFVSTGHLLLGMSYFATLLYVAWRTRPTRDGEEPARRQRAAAFAPARRWVALAVGMVFVQLLLGALVRHSEATLACIGMPTCTLGGEWFPAAWVQRLHMIHRGFGVLVGLVTITAAVQVWRQAAGWRTLRTMMVAAVAAVLLQITLGIYVVLTLRAVPIAVAHFAGAATLWGLWTYAWYMTSLRDRGAATSGDAQRPVLAPVRGVHAVP